jgi:hypothetical protein
MMMRLAAAVLSLAGMACCVAGAVPRAAHRMEQMSFVAPFNTHDAAGKKVVPFWDRSPTSVVKQSFVRIVPDLPRSKGVTWSRFALGKEEFSVMAKFRISGRDEKGGGESLGFFVADSVPSEDGGASFFGFGQSFVGIGVVVDTRRESSGPGQQRHRDITVIANNGTRSEVEVMENIVGCNANVRFWERRDDFNVLKASRIRFKFEANSMSVEVDSRNTGRWRRCATLTDMAMPEGWAKQSSISIVGVNGDGSNNADVLELRSFEQPGDAWDVEKFDDDDLEDDYDLLVHHMEHEMFSVEQGLKATLSMLEDAEQAAEERIELLERRLSAGVTDALESRIASLEAQVQRRVSASINNRINSAERGITNRLETNILNVMKDKSVAWRTPFYLLLGVIGAMCLVIVMKYRDLKKQHIL